MGVDFTKGLTAKRMFIVDVSDIEDLFREHFGEEAAGDVGVGDGWAYQGYTRIDISAPMDEAVFAEGWAEWPDAMCESTYRDIPMEHLAREGVIPRGCYMVWFDC